MSFQNDLKEYMLLQGVSDVGFSKPDGDTPEGLPYAVTVVVRLSPAIIDEIDDITNKVETGEYVTESKNINGVTFVTIRANNNTTNGVGNDDNLR